MASDNSSRRGARGQQARHLRSRRTAGVPIPLFAGMACLAALLCVAVLRGTVFSAWGDAAQDKRPEETVAASRPDATAVNEKADPSASQDKSAPAYRSELARMFAEGEVGSVRVIGDSITAGYLADNYDEDAVTDTVVYSGALGTYTETPANVGCWTNDFRSYALSHRATSFVNAGISGFRMEYLAQDPAAWLGDGADVIVVMLGTNDAAKESVSDFEGYARTALAEADAKCKLLVVVSPPNNERTDAVNLYGMDQVDQVLSRICDEKNYLHISQLNTLVVGSDDFNSDQVHPTTPGSNELWKSFAEQLGLD